MTFKELKNRIKLILKYGLKKKEYKVKVEVIDNFTKLLVALSKCSLSSEQAMENLRTNIMFMKFCDFVHQNKETLKEDYLRQANI
jgi:hypothetical protein